MLLEFLQSHGCLDEDFRPARDRKPSRCLQVDADTTYAGPKDSASKPAKKGWDRKKALKTFSFVTCGDWDLKTMAPTQFQLSHLKVLFV